MAGAGSVDEIGIGRASASITVGPHDAKQEKELDDDSDERGTYSNNCPWRTSGCSSGMTSPVFSCHQVANMRR